MFLFFLVMLIYGGASYYASSWWIGMAGAMVSGFVLWFWILAVILSSLPLLSRIMHRAGITRVELLTVIGDYWMAVIFSSVLARGCLDIIGMIDAQTTLLPQMLKAGFGHTELSVSAFALLFIWGLWNARNPVVRTYNINVEKGVENSFLLRAALLSDLHLGGIIGKTRLKELVDKINALNPDIIFLAGDTIDDDVDYFASHKLGEPFLHLKPRYGTYAVLGNHEYIGGQPDEAVRLLQEAGIRVLRDQVALVAERFVVAGRDDFSKNRYTGTRRKRLTELLSEVNQALPVILLDHQPTQLDEASEAGVDIQVSGHTHKGQFFPLNLITAAVHENNWGLLVKGQLHTIVSSGFGTWGPPIRIGSRAEIIVLNIRVQ